MTEAVVAMTIMSIAGAGLLLDVGSLLSATDSQLRQFTANGLALQMMDEIAGMRYMENGASPTGALGPEAGEKAGPGRSLFDDIDDYTGLVVQPPADRWGIALGADDGDGSTRDANFQLASTTLARYKLQVSVFYVQPSAPTTPLGAGSTSNYRTVQVQVFYNDPVSGLQQVASLSRVFSYVPSP